MMSEAQAASGPRQETVRYSVSRVFTADSGGTGFEIRGCAAGGGGGGGGASPAGEGGLAGDESPPRDFRAELVPGQSYVVLIGAGGVGGKGAKRLQDHGEGGTEGGYGAVTDGEKLLLVIDGRMRSTTTLAEVLGTGPVASPTFSDELGVAEPKPNSGASSSNRYAIVDIDSNEVDNVIVAADDFFEHPLVRRAVLTKRIARQGGEFVLRERLRDAQPVLLTPQERVAPGWVYRGTGASPRFEVGEPAAMQRAIVGARAGPGGTSPPPADLSRPSLRVLAIATEWWSKHGGISTLNREMCIALAAAGHQVVCLVLSPPHGQALIDPHGVILVPAPLTTGKHVDERTPLYRRLRLPHGFVPDVIIGHAHVTGVAAMAQAEDSFPNAARIHIVHTTSDIERYKNGNDEIERATQHETEELHRAKNAALVVGIGPALHEWLEPLFAGLETRPATLEIVPGIVPGLEGDVKQPDRTTDCLLVGRTEDCRLKGIDIAAQAVRRARALGVEAVLAIRGAQPDEIEALREKLVSAVGCGPHAVRVNPFDSDPCVVRDDMLRSSVVLMPSRSEGFGLVAWEAIGLAVPVLVSSESGVAKLLRREVPQIADQFVVPMEEANALLAADAVLAERWAERIRNILVDPRAAFDRAAELRKALRPRFTWSAAVAKLMAAIREAAAAKE